MKSNEKRIIYTTALILLLATYKVSNDGYDDEEKQIEKQIEKQMKN